MELPQLAYPLQFDPAGGFALVEQDSAEDLTGRAHAVLDCPIGWIDSRPTFGTPDLAFMQPDDAAAAAKEAVEAWLPADVSLNATGEMTDGVSALITATLERANG